MSSRIEVLEEFYKTPLKLISVNYDIPPKKDSFVKKRWYKRAPIPSPDLSGPIAFDLELPAPEKIESKILDVSIKKKIIPFRRRKRAPYKIKSTPPLCSPIPFKSLKNRKSPDFEPQSSKRRRLATLSNDEEFFSDASPCRSDSMPPLCSSTDSCDDSFDGDSGRLFKPVILREGRDHNTMTQKCHPSQEKPFKRRKTAKDALSPNTLFSASMKDFMTGLGSLMDGKVGAKAKDNEIMSLRQRNSRMLKQKRLINNTAPVKKPGRLCMQNGRFNTKVKKSVGKRSLGSSQPKSKSLQTSSTRKSIRIKSSIIPIKRTIL